MVGYFFQNFFHYGRLYGYGALLGTREYSKCFSPHDERVSAYVFTDGSMLANGLLFFLVSPMLRETLEDIHLLDDMKTVHLPDASLEDMVCFQDLLLSGSQCSMSSQDIDRIQRIANILCIDQLLNSQLKQSTTHPPPAKDFEEDNNSVVLRFRKVRCTKLVSTSSGGNLNYVVENHQQQLVPTADDDEIIPDPPPPDGSDNTFDDDDLDQRPRRRERKLPRKLMDFNFLKFRW